MKMFRPFLSAICCTAVLLSIASCKPIEPETPTAKVEEDNEEVIFTIDPADIVVGEPEYGGFSDNL